MSQKGAAYEEININSRCIINKLISRFILPNSTINMAKYQSDNNMSLITEKDNIIPGKLWIIRYRISFMM